MSENKVIKQKYHHDMNVIRLLVNEFDPSGLIHFGAPSDEYDCMNGDILRMVYDDRTRQEISDYMIHHIEHHIGTPDLSELDEPFRTEFFQDLNKVLDGLHQYFGKSTLK